MQAYGGEQLAPREGRWLVILLKILLLVHELEQRWGVWVLF